MTTVKTCIAQKPPAIFSLESGASVFDALELMHAHRIRSVMIVDRGALKGIVSERDCALKVLRAGLDAHTTRLAEIMTSEPITVTPEDSLDNCMKIMTTRSIRHLPVMGASGVVGMISVGDIVKELMRQQQQHIQYLETYIKGHSGSY
jgi:CBS domain-containing protein